MQVGNPENLLWNNDVMPIFHPSTSKFGEDQIFPPYSTEIKNQLISMVKDKKKKRYPSALSQKVKSESKPLKPKLYVTPSFEKRQEILLNIRARGGKFGAFTNEQLLYLTDPETLAKQSEMTGIQKIEEFRSHFKLKDDENKFVASTLIQIYKEFQVELVKTQND